MRTSAANSSPVLVSSTTRAGNRISKAEKSASSSVRPSPPAKSCAASIPRSLNPPTSRFISATGSTVTRSATARIASRFSPSDAADNVSPEISPEASSTPNDSPTEKFTSTGVTRSRLRYGAAIASMPAVNSVAPTWTRSTSAAASGRPAFAANASRISLNASTGVSTYAQPG